MMMNKAKHFASVIVLAGLSATPLVASAAVSNLRLSEPLSSVLRRAEKDGFPDTARGLVKERTAKVLTNDLLLVALQASPVPSWTLQEEEEEEVHPCNRPG